MRYSILWLLLVLLTTSVRADERPNIVFLLADDLGWRDTGVYGSRFHRTPSIDGLAAGGMRFSDAYAASPLCSPTRGSILTGQYPGRLRLTTPAGHLEAEVLDPTLPERAAPNRKAVTPGTRTRLPNTYFTLAEALDEVGYATAFVGKWHLGREPYLPDHQGFDVVVGGRQHPGPPGGYFAPWPIDTIPESPPGSHISDVTTTEAIKFIRQERDEPFFLCLWFYDVHAPFEAKAELIEKYRQRLQPGDPQRCPTYGAMVDTLDTSVGRVLAALDEAGLTDETLVLFTSDNGGNMYNTVDDTTPTSNAPLRNGKGSIYEGGVRVPLIVSWPGRIEPGCVSDQVVTSVDYYPTLLEVVGVTPKPGQTFDGESILPVLRGKGPVERDAIFCHFPHYVPATGNLPSTSVRQGRWKLIRYYADNDDQTDRFELYDLTRDVGERSNLAESHPDEVRRLNGLIDAHIVEAELLVPAPNPAYTPTILGWAATHQAVIARHQLEPTDDSDALPPSVLRVTTTGGDPRLATEDVPPLAEPVVFELRMRTTLAKPPRVYWSTKRGRSLRNEGRGSWTSRCPPRPSFLM